jgi:hypothetical protein
LPQSLEFKYKLGTPGSKANDKVVVVLRNSVENSDTGLVSTGSVAITLSLPRDSEWTVTDGEDLLIQLQDLFTDANAAKLVDAITP